MNATILIVEDEKHTRNGLAQALEEQYDVYEAANAQEAFRLMETESFDVVLTDLKMAGKDGMHIVDKTLKLSNKPICIMMTAFGNIEIAVEAMKRGAYDFLPKPVNLAKLEILIKRALQAKTLERQNQFLQERINKELHFNDKVIGSSPTLNKALNEIKQVAPTKATVLLFGETGTGKELFAQMIHQKSRRATYPFIAVHCAALNPNLLESELFGHEKGAFTGANERRIGRFEAANGGTLFLDEIGEIDSSTQIKLLRFLETKTFERLGSSKPINVDVRFVCATNKNLEEMVEKKAFREDLLYRLNTITIKLPPLRERKDDISLLLDYYIDHFSKENRLSAPTLEQDAIEVLKNYSWPGNIRQLKSFAEHTVIMKHGETINKYDLDAKFYTNTQSSFQPQEKNNLFNKTYNEKKALINALKATKGNKTEAARLLGISRRTIHRWLTEMPELEN